MTKSDKTPPGGNPTRSRWFSKRGRSRVAGGESATTAPPGAGPGDSGLVVPSQPENPPPLRRSESVRRPTSAAEALEPKPAPGPIDDQQGRRSRKRRMKGEGRSGFAGFIYFFASLFLIMGIVGGTLLFFAWRSFEAPGPLSQQVVVDIRSGVGLATIAEQLLREDIIEDEFVFMGGVILNDVKGRLKAGEYQIPPRASMRDVMEILVEGKALLYSITIPEGWTSYDVSQRINGDENLEGSPISVPDEGVLLPETYSFPRGTSRAKVISQMRDAHTRLLDQLWEERAPDLPISSKSEAVVLASIVEKETGQPEERPLVASVFINRLRRGMRLQSDPTIIYGITNGQGPLGRPIRQSEIDAVTPYNTYQVNGLPPTPIANPGKASIEAILKPAQSDYLFFVADGTGGHVFATTLAEHTRNVARWRVIERERAAERKAAEKAAAELPASSAVVETETGDLPLPGQ